MNRSHLTRLLMFAWLTIGFGVVHVALCSWSIGIGMAMWPDPTPYEHLQIDETGEPLIQSWGSGNREVSYRRIDGTPIPNVYNIQRKMLGAASIYERPDAEPGSWGGRITSFQDFQIPTTYWYHVEPTDRPGTSYFEGFEKLSRRRVGYLGKNGFATQRPTVEESFPIRPSTYAARVGLLTSAQYSNWEVVEPYNYGSTEWVNAPADAVWLLSHDTIYEIRLQSRTVRPVLENQKTMRFLTQSPAPVNGTGELRLLVRTDEGILFVDPQSGRTDLLKLTQKLMPGNTEMIYQTKDGQWLMSRSTNPRSQLQKTVEYNIQWFDDSGKVQREEKVSIPSRNGGLPLMALPFCVPVPAIACGAWLTIPVVASEFVELSSSYTSRLMAVTIRIWPWVISSIAVGLLAGWGCWRREREVFRRNGWFWPVLVGCSGWFGWVGYICVFPLPARLPAGQWLPGRPEPTHALGTEIYA